MLDSNIITSYTSILITSDFFLYTYLYITSVNNTYLSGINSNVINNIAYF